MQSVTESWKQTNRDNFTRPANMTLSFRCNDGTVPIVSGTKLITFNYNKSGDILSGVLTQDTITFTIDNSDGRFTYNPENDRFTLAPILITCGFARPDYQLYDGISGGRYYVSDVDAVNNRTSFVAKTILGFMKTQVGDLTGTAAEVAAAVIRAAELDDAVPSDDISYSLDSSLNSVDIEIRASDNYTQAEVLQLISNACGCVLYTDRIGTIVIKPLEQFTENYVLSGKISYEFPKVKVLEKTGRINMYYDHGSGYVSTNSTIRQSGATQTVTNPAIVDDFDAMDALWHMFQFNQVARKRITGNFRADPRIDLFDVVAVPYLNKVAVCCITKINFTFNGAWRGTYEAVEVPDAKIDLLIDDLEMLTIEQLGSIKIDDLHPNTISDIDGDYMAASEGSLAYWEEVENE